MKLNNRGQSLVAFVLLIPILFLIFLAIYEIGNMTLLKQEINDINYMAIDYGIDNISDENISDKIRALIIKNKSDIDKIEINIDGDKINVLLEDKLDTKTSLFKGLFKVKSQYVGYKIGDKKIIERNK